jgi:hypothetical protein
MNHLQQPSNNEPAKAVMAEIKVAGTNLVCLQMPNGSYRLDLQQISLYAGFNPGWLSSIRRRQPTMMVTLTTKYGFSDEVKKISYWNGKTNVTALTIPLDDAVAIFRYGADIDKPESKALYDACLAETLERRADKAFGIDRSEEERDQRLEARRRQQIRQWRRMGKSEQWIEQRLNNIDEYQPLFKEEQVNRKVNNFGIANNTNAIYRSLVDQKASEIKQEKGVKIAKDGLNEIELTALSLAQLMSVKKMKTDNAQGGSETYHICKDAGQIIRSAIEDYL